MDVHKNARLTPQGRALLVRRIRAQGWRVRDAAAAAGISKRSAFRWLARHRAGGELALQDRSSAGHRARRFWRIRGYKGLEEFFDEKIAVGALMQDELKELLRCLAAKEGLSYNEIIGAYVKRKTKLANDLLCIHQDIHQTGLYPAFLCGNDPHFIATVVDERGDKVVLTDQSLP